VLAPPETATGRVNLKLCQPDGSATHRLVTRREGDAFKRARRVDWGDTFEG
jgi:ribosomal protein RSM22 (predicted rRNA methylase)